MPPRLHDILFLFAFSLAVSALAVGICYAWFKFINSPLRLYQRKMLAYVAIVMASCPVLTSSWMASSYWLMPFRPSAIVAVALFAIWCVLAFKIVKRMSRPGGRLSRERE
jgi:CHASE2 domain-containing sensor protein